LFLSLEVVVSAIESAYIEALRVELSRARDEDHAAQVREELARVGAPVIDIIETASANPQTETAAAPKRKAKA
jgi:hypothetical protein